MMNATTDSDSISVAAENAAPTIDEEVERIIESGALGRSPVYSRLLRYLAQATGEGRSPKELEIAIEVLERGPDFDVSRDSSVRVYIHQLRKRLERHYQGTSRTRHRLVLPKGQYTLALEDNDPLPHAQRSGGRRMRRLKVTSLALMVASALCGALLTWLLTATRPAPPATTGPVDAARPALDHPAWSNIMDDTLPVIIAMGDHYIFGETGPDGSIQRMVRDFSINSPADLARMRETSPETRDQYTDLSLSYLPEGSAAALATISQLAGDIAHRTTVRMVSSLSSADLRQNHVIYIGYVSGLGLLEPLYFAASGLRVGRSYDELYERERRRLHRSTAAMPENDGTGHDLALLATVPGINNNQLLIIAGTRDPGLRSAAQLAASPEALQALDNALSLSAQRPAASQEGLWRVPVDDGMTATGELVYSRRLDPTRIWSRQIE